ncbi:hypothetical protein CLOACE_04310 [Clostridium acetireducens DSM 10703]|uniref:Uncharacterized protein n=1 Tax=Clostridium acetireducens DSM 10703 TaxID=1121290 RepID=A0A1E8F247_9CLOT|nr:hypothetical protein [Clostridium acetireducens]OFI07239.1 hypothetical protein CLOACE_04310 [Clostridium acetireducens DSM 10703]
MYSLSYKFINNTPMFKCNFCGKCSHVMESTSYTPLATRGCCWYFPKYTLINIKNILALGKKDFILQLLNMPNAHISQYFIEIKGLFDKKCYEDFVKNSLEENINFKDFDIKLFFRLCPFCTSTGCKLDFTLRPHPCNLYLCRTVLELCGDKYKPYSEERKDYFSYCNYFNESIKYELMENKVDLISNAEKSLEIINNMDIPAFQPKLLEDINFDNPCKIAG